MVQHSSSSTTTVADECTNVPLAKPAAAIKNTMSTASTTNTVSHESQYALFDTPKSRRPSRKDVLWNKSPEPSKPGL